jgi:hypothetical protein
MINENNILTYLVKYAKNELRKDLVQKVEDWLFNNNLKYKVYYRGSKIAIRFIPDYGV